MKSGTVFCLIVTPILVAAGYGLTMNFDLPHCPKCHGNVNEVYDKYCPHCGHKLQRDSLVWYDECTRMKVEKMDAMKDKLNK